MGWIKLAEWLVFLLWAGIAVYYTYLIIKKIDSREEKRNNK